MARNGAAYIDLFYGLAKTGATLAPSNWRLVAPEDVRVVDSDNDQLGPNKVCELVLKFPGGCSGYFNNPEITAAIVDDEGWFHTGNMVYYPSIQSGWRPTCLKLSFASILKPS